MVLDRDITVREILETTGQKVVYRTTPTTSAREAASKMREKKISSLVVSADGTMVGIVTERDFTWRCVAEGKDPETTSVAEIMTADPKTVSLFTSAKECENLMIELEARHVPVMDQGENVGIVSIRDLLFVTRRDRDFLAQQALGYIRGG